MIADLNPFLRGWGNYFRTGNAADKFRPARPLRGVAAAALAGQEAGPQPACRAGQTWTEDWFHGQGLHRLRAPSATRRRRNHVKKTIGKPYAGKPHVRIERGMGKRARTRHRAPDYQ